MIHLEIYVDDDLLDSTKFERFMSHLDRNLRYAGMRLTWAAGPDGHVKVFIEGGD